MIVHASSLCPPWMPQLSSLNVEAMDSNDEKTEEPNSETCSNESQKQKDCGNVGCKAFICSRHLQNGFQTVVQHLYHYLLLWVSSYQMEHLEIGEL